MGRRVLLVHGLWMRAPALIYWARGLAKAGFDPVFFSYRSLTQSPEAAIRRLRNMALQDPDCHVLAHSLGGLIAVKALSGCPGHRGRIICVGSPLAGSQVVRRYAKTALGRLAGNNTELLS